MKKSKPKLIIPKERILMRIVQLRKERVILDVHLAELYGVETRILKQAVRRNRSRFPIDFMFELTHKEIAAVVSQNVIPHKKYLGGAFPFAFTESGVAMLSSVLKSRTAIKINIAIMRTFITLRNMAIDYKEIKYLLDEMKSKYDSKFEAVFKILEQLINPPPTPRRRIGFRRNNEEMD